MIKAKLISLYILLHSLLPAADFKGNEHPKVQIKKTGRLSDQVDESSGLEIYKSDTLFTHNDGDGRTNLYSINAEGKLLETRSIENAENIDWEDLAKDKDNTLYIGDFGNNLNSRRNLKIYQYKINTQKITGEIEFRYPDQHDFPPPQEGRNFDCEAMFWHNDSLFLISKNRGNNWVKLYRIPDQPGEYTVELIDSIKIGSMVTAADISPDGKSFTLLAYGKIYFFKIKEGRMNFQYPWFTRSFLRSGQAEAIVYLNNEELVVTNEGGKIFKVMYR